MQGLLDIYTRLIIGILSFVAPMTVHLLSMFSEGIATIKRRNETERAQIEDLLRAAMPVGSQIDPSIIKEHTNALQKTEKKNNTRINLLTPSRQILRIFSTLFLSLLFVMIYKFVKDPDFKCYNSFVAKSLLILSCGCFISGVLILWQVARAVIGTKIIMGEEKSAVSLERQENLN